MKARSTPFTFFRYCLAGMAAFSTTLLVAVAASGTFNPAGGEWSTTTNWTPNGTVGAPSATAPTTFTNQDVATFSGGGAGTTVTVTDSSPYRTIQRLTFSNATTDLANYTIGSSANTLYFRTHGSSSTTGNITIAGTGTTGSSLTIASNLMATAASGADNNDLRIGGTTDFNGTLTLSGNISSTATSSVSSIRVITSGSTSSSANSNSNNRVVFSGIISDGGGSNKVYVSRGRNGVVLFTGANTFSGGYSMGADMTESSNSVTQLGVASVGAPGAIVSGPLGTGLITMRSGTLSSDGTTARTLYNEFITGSAPLYLGTSTNNGALTFAGNGTLVTGNSMVANVPVTFSGNLGGAGGLYKSGSSSMTLSGQNTYSGTMTANSGLVIVASNQALGNTSGKTLVNSQGMLQLAAGVTVTGETLEVIGDGLAFNGALTSAAGTATWAGPITLTGAARMGAAGDSNLVLSGPISGNFALSTTGGLGADGQGTVVISAAAGQNTYTGATNVLRGTLKIGADNSLPTTTVLDVDSAGAVENSTFDLNGFNQTVGALQRTGAGSGAGGSTLTNSSGEVKTLTVNQTTNTSFTGQITGNLALTKAGSGTLTLSDATGNSYTGTTTVSGGTLVVNTIQPLATGNVLVTSGGTLAGSGTIGGATTIQGIHSPGNSPGIQRFSSDLTYASGSVFNWELASDTTTGRGTAFDGVNVGGTLTINAATFRINLADFSPDNAFWTIDQTWDVFDATTTTGNFSQFVLYDDGAVTDYSSYGSFSFIPSTGSLQWTAGAVPEPSNALAGLLIAAGLLRRKRGTAA